MKQPSAIQILCILTGVLALALVVLFWPVASMIIVGASVAVVLLPMHHNLSLRTKPWLSAALLTAMVCGMALVIVSVTFFIFSKNTVALTDLIDTIGSWLTNPSTILLTVSDQKVPPSAASYVHSQFVHWLGVSRAFFIDFETTILLNGTWIVIQSCIFFLSVFVLLLYGEKLKENVFARIPFLSVQKHNARLSSVTFDTLHVIYVAQFAIAVLTFFISIPVFYLLGYGNILLYSFLAAFCELIPVFGATVAFIIIGAYALARGDIQGLFVLFFLGYIGVAALPEIFIRPVLMGRRVRVHPAVMFVGFIGGIITMGFAGFILGPVLLVLCITWYRIYGEEKQVPAGTPVKNIQ
jgi:predicted PurR-regulated permease PerM